MKTINISLVVGLFLAASVSKAVITPSPVFVSPRTENFDTKPLGAYLMMPAMSGFAMIRRTTAAGTLLIDVAGSPFSPPNSLRGNGTDVVIRLSAASNRFGGYFCPTFAPLGVVSASFVFRDAAGAMVGSWVASWATATWRWEGFDSSIPFRSVEIRGVAPGTFWMDNLTVN
ncbi:MAG TPA: hypothetical protein PLL78_14220 [Fimbriimonadaceae bacterium]|nr:hypothetical protein [Fimbriimonadaceae bacterium]HRJ97833.1 hypothetical protein [Fimbriimonadaceae bacterium]